MVVKKAKNIFKKTLILITVSQQQPHWPITNFSLHIVDRLQLPGVDQNIFLSLSGGFKMKKITRELL